MQLHSLYIYLLNRDSKTQKDSLENEKSEDTKDTEEEVDIDLTDPDVEAAAVKIQAGFKGFKTRKEMKSAVSVVCCVILFRVYKLISPNMIYIW